MQLFDSIMGKNDANNNEKTNQKILKWQKDKRAPRNEMRKLQMTKQEERSGLEVKYTNDKKMNKW